MSKEYAKELLHMTLANRMDQLPDCRRRTRERLESVKATPRVIYAAEVVLEELLTNLIRYAYTDKREHEIAVSLYAGNKTILIRIEDDSQAFDPSIAPQTVPPRSLSEAPVGGLGLKLVHSLADRIFYQRIDNINYTEIVLETK